MSLVAAKLNADGRWRSYMPVHITVLRARSFVLALLVCEPLASAMREISVSFPGVVRSSHATYGENSPNFLPTISSVTYTSWYSLPLWTANFRPTKLGRMVAARARVRMMG